VVIFNDIIAAEILGSELDTPVAATTVSIIYVIKLPTFPTMLGETPPDIEGGPFFAPKPELDAPFIEGFQTGVPKVSKLLAIEGIWVVISEWTFILVPRVEVEGSYLLAFFQLS